MDTTAKREGTDPPRDAAKASPEEVAFHASRRVSTAAFGSSRDRIWVLFFVVGLVAGALTTVAAQHAMPGAAAPEPVAVASEADYEADVAALAVGNSRTVRERIFRVVNSVEIEIGAAREELDTALLAEPASQ